MNTVAIKPLLITSGEPAGIGPDLCLEAALWEWPVVVMACPDLLYRRARLLNKDITLCEYQPDVSYVSPKGHLQVIPLPLRAPTIAGVLNTENAAYVMTMLYEAVTRCRGGEFSALITAPVHKAVINQAGIAFTGHTEFFARQCGVAQVVMMLASDAMKVALVTTHLPLKDVSAAITSEKLFQIVHQLYAGLERDFGIKAPRIAVAGLNPHAGEGGYLGREEIDTIIPAIKILQQQSIPIEGPFSADTLFTPALLADYDAVLAMYHDQGLPVIKYASFGHAVNVTLGLPIIRTSVDHGTALHLSGTGRADSGSLFAAVQMAFQMVQSRGRS